MFVTTGTELAPGFLLAGFRIESMLGRGGIEKRISDEEVSAARAKIAAGATLTSAAAEIPCAPSTLSVRIRKAEAAEAGARDRVPISEQELLAAGRAGTSWS